MVGPAWRRSAYSHGLSRVQGRVDTRAMANHREGKGKEKFSIWPRFVPHLARTRSWLVSNPTTGFMQTRIHRGRGARAVIIIGQRRWHEPLHQAGWPQFGAHGQCARRAPPRLEQAPWPPRATVYGGHQWQAAWRLTGSDYLRNSLNKRKMEEDRRAAIDQLICSLQNRNIFKTRPHQLGFCAAIRGAAAFTEPGGPQASLNASHARTSASSIIDLTELFHPRAQPSATGD